MVCGSDCISPLDGSTGTRQTYWRKDQRAPFGIEGSYLVVWLGLAIGYLVVGYDGAPSREQCRDRAVYACSRKVTIWHLIRT